MISLPPAIEIAACDRFYQPSKNSTSVPAPHDSAMTAGPDAVRVAAPTEMLGRSRMPFFNQGLANTAQILCSVPSTALFCYQKPAGVTAHNNLLSTILEMCSCTFPVRRPVMYTVGAQSGTSRRAVLTVDSQNRVGSNAAGQRRRGNVRAICPHCGQPESLGHQGTAGPLRRFPRWRAASLTHASHVAVGNARCSSRQFRQRS